MFGRWSVVWLGMAVGGCGALGPGPSREPEPSSEAASEVVRYTSEARPAGGPLGAAGERLRTELLAALQQRGGQVEADGALAGTASWGLREVREGRSVDLIRAEAASRRLGFGGVLLSFMVFDDQHQNVWREQLERTPNNAPITRYGISVSADGHAAAVVFGAVELEYAPLARTFEPGQHVELKGRIAERFQSCQVYLTKPDGSVDAKRLPERDFDVSFPLVAAGKYRLEVMGDGASGPVVLANLPLYVGAAESELEGAPGAVVSPAEAEARLLTLLNDARRAAGLGKLQADAELRNVASRHSLDMAEHGFVGHVSPTTGRPDDRVRSAGVLVSQYGENVVTAATPEVAHEALMSSPGHRANMLQPRFTHVGIAATKNANGLVATLLFARRPPVSELPTSASQVEGAIVQLRAEKGVIALEPNPAYRAAAQAGAEARGRGDEPQAVNDAVVIAFRNAAGRRPATRPPECNLTIELLELSQLNEYPALTAAGLRQFGVGALSRTDAVGTRLSTVILYEGVPCD